MAWENKNHNMILCENILDSVSVNQIDLVIFPEMTLTGFSMNTQKIVEGIQGSKTINFFKNLALKKKINIIFGMVLKRAVEIRK
jgi:predicted amidohydrolase